MRKHITCASPRKIIELHFNFNLHTTVSINTVYSLYDIYCINNYNDYSYHTEFQNLGGGEI